MGILRTAIGKGRIAALALAAGLSLAAQGALAQHHGHSSSSGSGHSSSSGSGHFHSSGSGNFHPNHHFSGGPGRVFIAPAFPRRFYYVPAPYYYSAPPVYAAAPIVTPSLNSGYWYFCPDNRLYYPQALECPSGWLTVVPGGQPY